MRKYLVWLKRLFGRRGGYGLGRVQMTDDRDGLYPMGRVLQGMDWSRRERRIREWRTGPILDQLDGPTCVGFAFAQWLQTLPRGTQLTPELGGNALYLAAKKIDGMPGIEGTTVRAGAKVLRNLGRVAYYVWSSSLTDLKRWLLFVGPVIAGTSWFASMFTPDRRGVVSISGEQVGGHAYAVVSYDDDTRLFKCANSWGPGWGNDGCFYIADKSLWSLVTSFGEACAAVEKAP